MADEGHSLEKLAAELADLRGRVEVKEVAEAHRHSALSREVEEVRQLVEVGGDRAKEPPLQRLPLPGKLAEQHKLDTEVRRLCKVIEGLQDKVEELQRKQQARETSSGRVPEEASSGREPNEASSGRALDDALEQRLEALEQSLETRLRAWQTEQLAELPERLAQAMVQSEDRLRSQLEEWFALAQRECTEAVAAQKEAAAPEESPAEAAQTAHTLLERRFEALEHKLAVRATFQGSMACDPELQAGRESSDPLSIQAPHSGRLRRDRSGASSGSMTDRSSQSSMTSESSNGPSEVLSKMMSPFRQRSMGARSERGGDPMSLHREKSDHLPRDNVPSRMFSSFWLTHKEPSTESSGSRVERVSSRKSVRTSMELNHMESYSLAASTWDACLLVGQGSVNFGDSILLCLACVIGFVLQAVFCIIVLSTMTQDPLGHVDLDQIRQWRLFTGHSAQYYEPIGGTSLVARVCAGTNMLSISGMQADLYDSLSQFTQSEGGPLSAFNGRLLCALCLVLWVLVILKEFITIQRFATMLLRKTKSGRSRVAAHSGSYKLESISRRRCAAILAFNVLPRVGIAVLLFISGLLFLGHTDNLGDLLMNALALTFILDIDDLLFGAIVPASVRHVQENLEAIPIHKVSRKQLRHRCADLQVILTLVLVFGTVLLVDQTISQPFFQYMHDATDTLCGGDVNFVVAKNKATNVLYAAPTQDVSQTGADGYVPPGSIKYEKVALLQRTSLPELGAWSDGAPSYEDAKSQSTAYMEATIEEVSDLWASTGEASAAELACADVFASDNASDFAVAANEAMFYYFNNSAFNCSSLAHLCHNKSSDYRMIRALCPHTCGCHDPVEGHYDLAGCSTQCKSSWLRHAKRFAADRSTPCADLNATELANLSSWGNFVREFEDALSGSGFLEDTLHHMNTTNDLFNEFMQSGCSIIASLVDHSPIDPCDTTSDTHASAAFFCPATCQLAC